jgi:hypothetical protein
VSHNTGLSLDLSDRTHLANTKDTLHARKRMHAGQDNEFYSSDQETWTAMSTGVGTGEKPLVDKYLPSGSCTH